MPRGMPREVATHLAKAVDSAIAAVDCYNRCGTVFRSGSYIVLMCIAWTSLLHAVFFRQKLKPFYRESETGRRYKRVDGDYKAWELKTCIQRYYPGETNPVVQNLHFLIGLRNKIEHRSLPELDNLVFGECQACLFNFEELLTREFGHKHALSHSLSLAIQFSRLRDGNQGRAVTSLHSSIRSDIRAYIDTFRSSLSAEMTADERYSFKVFLIPKVATSYKPGDIAVEFIRFDPSNREQMEQYDKVTALIKPTHIQVANAGRLKAKDVCKRVEPVVKSVVGSNASFNPSFHHFRACIYYNIRPRTGATSPAKTNPEMCHYDDAHKDYVFTERWVAFLTDKLKQPGEYQRILESKPSQQT
jgi:hypothetical protein